MVAVSFDSSDLQLAVYAGCVLTFVQIAVVLWPRERARQILYSTGLGTAVCTVALGSLVAAYAPSQPMPQPAPLVIPQPVHTDLAALVPADQRKVVGAFYRDLAAVVANAPAIQSTDQLRDGYRNGGAILKQVGRLPPGLADFAAATDQLLSAALTKESRTLTAEDRQTFATACLSIAAALGVTP